MTDEELFAELNAIAGPTRSVVLEHRFARYPMDPDLHEQWYLRTAELGWHAYMSREKCLEGFRTAMGLDCPPTERNS